MYALNKNFIHRGTFWGRFRGLMGRKNLSKHDAILLYPCKQVHTFFMRFPIAVIYLTHEGYVVWAGVLPPWKIGPVFSNAYYVIESSDLKIVADLKPGTRVNIPAKGRSTSTKN